MQSTEKDDKATPAEKLQNWLDFAEANRPGHDSLRGVSYEPAPIRQAWLADVLAALAAERDRAERAEAKLITLENMIGGKMPFSVLRADLLDVFEATA